MREDIYQFELMGDARVRSSGSLLIVDPVCVKDVKCDWFKHFAPPSAYEQAENLEELMRVRRCHAAALDERISNAGGIATTRHVARFTHKLMHYLDLSHRIVETSSKKDVLVPPLMVQGQHGVYFRTGYAPNSHQVIEDKNGYVILFSEVPHPMIHSEVASKSGMLMVVDGKTISRENLKFEKGVDYSAVCRIKVHKGTYSCSFSKDGLKFRIKKI